MSRFTAQLSEETSAISTADRSTIAPQPAMVSMVPATDSVVDILSINITANADD